MTIRILPSRDALAEAAAAELAGWIDLNEGPVSVGLAGGTTPEATYRALRTLPVPWERLIAWMADERHVPPDHPESNAGMVRRALFDHVGARFLEAPFLPRASETAEEYEAILAEELPHDPFGRIEPGLLLLGMGADGHTASLFPDSDALDETERDFVAVEVAERGWRITATLGLLARARRILFLVAGREKATAVADALEGDSDRPAAVVSRLGRDVVWLLDREAASQLWR